MPATIRMAENAPRQEKMIQIVKNILEKKDFWLSVGSCQWAVVSSQSGTTDY
jgi:hypothetical protein